MTRKLMSQALVAPRFQLN